MKENNHFLILSSPPGSGKTFWISDFAQALKGTDILVISPLRVLADECRANLGDAVAVETPESWLSHKTPARVVIFDEFHLLFYWGDSFRPVMWEVFFELSQSSELFIALTATISDSMREAMTFFDLQFDQTIWCNYGNQQLKNIPVSYVKLPSKKRMEEFILTEKPEKAGGGLIFCHYRQEVFRMAKRLELKGHVVWTCVGGESQEFSQRVATELPPDFIISTTVLSHGVNLPSITRIYFLYPVNCLDFWIQMVARGGRRGEKFKVFSLENPSGIRWSRTSNFFTMLYLSFRIKRQEFTEQFIQWFLKD